MPDHLTPRPWQVLPSGTVIAGPYKPSALESPQLDLATVAEFLMRLRTNEEAEANAAFTVRAVNCHAALVAACEEALAYVENDMEESRYPKSENRLHRILAAVLAKAKGKAL